MNYFVRKKYESPQELCERLNTLACEIERFECERGGDGFSITNNKFLVEKLLTVVATDYKNTVWSIRREHGFSTVTTDDVFATFLQYDEYDLKVKDNLLCKKEVKRPTLL